MSAISYLCHLIDVTVLNDLACGYVGMLACRHLALARIQGLFSKKNRYWISFFISMLTLVRSLGRRKVYHCDTGLS